MKERGWGVIAITAAVASAGLSMWYSQQGTLVFSAGEEATNMDIGFLNGTGLATIGTVFAALVAAWKSRSPQKITQFLCLAGLWIAAFGNQAATEKLVELIALLNAAPTPPPSPEVKSILEDIKGKIGELFKAENAAA